MIHDSRSRKISSPSHCRLIIHQAHPQSPQLAEVKGMRCRSFFCGTNLLLRYSVSVMATSILCIIRFWHTIMFVI